MEFGRHGIVYSESVSHDYKVICKENKSQISNIRKHNTMISIEEKGLWIDENKPKKNVIVKGCIWIWNTFRNSFFKRFFPYTTIEMLFV